MPVNPNVAGQAYALTVMTPIEPGREGELRAYLESLRDDASPLARLPRTHFGRWVIVPDFVSEPEQPKEDHLGGPYLLFTSNFDGPLDSYLDELCDRLGAEGREIWGRCAGCPPDAGPAELKAYLLHNRIETGFFVAAYPHATVARVRQSLDVRDRLIALLLRGQALAPRELQAAFEQEFGS